MFTICTHAGPLIIMHTYELLNYILLKIFLCLATYQDKEFWLKLFLHFNFPLGKTLYEVFRHFLHVLVNYIRSDMSDEMTPKKQQTDSNYNYVQEIEDQEIIFLHFLFSLPLPPVNLKFGLYVWTIFSTFLNT